MNPTQPTPIDPASPTGQPLVEFIRSQRQNAAYVLLALSVVFLGFTVWMATKGFAKTEAKTEEKAEATNPLEPEAEKPAEIVDPKQRDYRVGSLGTLVGFLITAGFGARLMLSPPKPTEREQRTDARVTLLTVGGFLGMALIVFGGLFFYRWSESLSNWLDKGETKEMQWVVIPLLMVVAGAGLVFAAVQPARAEERNNTALRRLVYGSNLGLTVLLLFVVLVIANVVFAMRVPNKLDTTATGFYTLSEPTREFLGQMDQTVTAYAILPDGGDRVVDDIRRLLQSAEDASGGKFRVEFVSPTMNKTQLATLRSRYTQLELDDIGVLLTVGDESQRSEGAPGRYTFIPRREFVDAGSPMSPESEPSFIGEAKLIREVMFLAESKQKPVVYFTQSNGELSVGGGTTDDMGLPQRSASQLKAFLEKNYLDVRSLEFQLPNPKVPDDADVVIVASPRSTLLPASVEAIRKYMNEPRPGGKKGKLVVLSGNPLPREGRKPVPTGLEPLLQEFNIKLGNEYIFGLDSKGPRFDEIPTAFTASAARARNPIVMTLRNLPPTVFLPKEVGPIAQGSPQYQATTLFVTDTDFVWTEPSLPDNLEKALNTVINNPGQRLLRFKSVGVVSAETGEGGKGRVAVYGSGLIASDLWAQRVRGTVPAEFDLIGVTIDWLRDRPPVPTGVVTKTYTTYTFPQKVDTTRLLWFPLGLSILVVAGLGAGVWVIRRK